MVAGQVELQKPVLTIRSKSGWFDLHLKDVWHYRHLILLFVRRDFVTFHKQTILGPLWYLIRPLFTAVIFTLVFGGIAKISTEGIPHFLFYLSGTITWNYFASCLGQTSGTFAGNVGIFGKVYFPRMTVPISASIFHLIQLGVRFVVFLGFYLFFFMRGVSIRPNTLILLFPVLVLQIALLGVGLGILVSSLTTKYRDLTFAMEFVVQGLFFMTPVIYPASLVGKYRFIYMLNPMASIVEMFRYSFLGQGTVDPVSIAISWVITLLVFFTGVLLFNRIERTFMDTV